MIERHTSAIHLLDREAAAESRLESTASVAVKREKVDRGTKSVVIFRIGAEWLALPANLVEEVSERCTVRTLPGHRGGILSGVVNLRGELLLCVALGVLIGLDAEGEDSGKRTSSGRLLICRSSEGKLAFQVSEVHGLYRYNPRDLRSAPATLARATGVSYALGVVPWKDRTVGCLDGELMFYALKKGLA